MELNTALKFGDYFDIKKLGEVYFLSFPFYIRLKKLSLSVGCLTSKRR